MRFAVKIGKDWKKEVEGLPEDALVHIDLALVTDYKGALNIPNQTIISLKPDWAGGKYFGSEVKRIEVLAEAIKAGADFVEIEGDMVEQYQEELLKLCEEQMCGRIVEFRYPKVPSKSQIQEDWEKYQGKADLVKFVCNVEDYQGCKKFLDLCTQDNLAIGGSGEKGELLGILGGLCGFYFGYSPVGKVKKALKLKLDGFSVSAFEKIERGL